MRPIWPRIVCIVLGCIPGGWLPAAHKEPLVQAYIRQCRRCRRFEQRGYVVHHAPTSSQPWEMSK